MEASQHIDNAIALVEVLEILSRSEEDIALFVWSFKRLYPQLLEAIQKAEYEMCANTS